MAVYSLYKVKVHKLPQLLYHDNTTSCIGSNISFNLVHAGLLAEHW